MIKTRLFQKNPRASLQMLLRLAAPPHLALGASRRVRARTLAHSWHQLPSWGYCEEGTAQSVKQLGKSGSWSQTQGQWAKGYGCLLQGREEQLCKGWQSKGWPLTGRWPQQRSWSSHNVNSNQWLQQRKQAERQQWEWTVQSHLQGEEEAAVSSQLQGTEGDHASD